MLIMQLVFTFMLVGGAGLSAPLDSGQVFAKAHGGRGELHFTRVFG